MAATIDDNVDVDDAGDDIHDAVDEQLSSSHLPSATRRRYGARSSSRSVMRVACPALLSCAVAGACPLVVDRGGGL
ncbi:MAG TPA: hypothetical protein VGF99_11345 [Myxococcota bacterium]